MHDGRDVAVVSLGQLIAHPARFSHAYLVHCRAPAAGGLLVRVLAPDPAATWSVVEVAAAGGVAAAEAAADSTARVMSLNIWNYSPPWQRRRAALAAAVRHAQPDVVVLQELRCDHRGHDGGSHQVCVGIRGGVRHADAAERR
jgi:hypothetical protein